MLSYQGETIRLRPLKKADLEKTIAWRNDPEVRENSLGYRFPVTEQMEEKWYASALNDDSRNQVIFSIETLEDGMFIGLTRLTRIDWLARLAFFGIAIGEKQFQGRGMARDAMRVLFGYAFDGLNLRKICLEVAAFNHRAITMYKKFGFAEEGILREQIYLEGNYHDLVLMGLFADEFRLAK